MNLSLFLKRDLIQEMNTVKKKIKKEVIYTKVGRGSDFFGECYRK